MDNSNQIQDNFNRELFELTNENNSLKELLKNLKLKLETIEELLIQQSNRYTILNKYSIELDNQPDEKIPFFIVNNFKSFFNVKEVWISTYDEKNAELVLEASTLSENENSKIAKILGRSFIGIRTPIVSKNYKKMIEWGIGEPSSLHKVFFGEIPEVISSSIEKLFGIGWFQGASLIDKGKLFGGLIFAGHQGQEILQKDELSIFIETTSTILRRKKTEKELIASEKRFRHLSDLLPQIIFESELDGNITFANLFSLKLLGYKKEDLQNGLNFFQIVAPTDRPFVISRMKEIINGGETTPKEFNVIRKDGSIFPILLHASLVIEDGDKKGIRGLGVDITDRKQAETEIQLKNEQLQKINAEKDKFFSIIAHDLRSPFNQFLGFTQILTGSLHSFSLVDLEEIAKNLRNSALNLYTLLENLLEWSGMQRGHVIFKPIQFNLLNQVIYSVDLISDHARKKEITININIPEKLEIIADSQMFNSIIRNLVSNAIKFTHRGGYIQISATDENNGLVEIEIKDSGIGMSEELLNKLFKIYERSNREGTNGEQSTGLGLLLCKEFIDKHHGNISVISEEGKGSIFSITLPLQS